jgi:hypothetical protein
MKLGGDAREQRLAVIEVRDGGAAGEREEEQQFAVNV